jgi:hypothetical protein
MAAIRAGGVDDTQWDANNTGRYSTAFGQNVRASGDHSFAVGLRSRAVNFSSVALGEDNVASGAGSIALGRGANTNTKRGSFVFADDSVRVENYSTAPTYFMAAVARSANWRTTGGFHVYANSSLTEGVSITGRHDGDSFIASNGWDRRDALISTSTGAYLANSGIWTNVSDRDKKTNFSAIDGRQVLRKVAALPMTSWNYKADPNALHIGPTAQDFHDAFKLGSDNKTIGTVDADGVALAAIQGLNEELKERDATIAALKEQNAAFEARLKKLEGAATAR